VCRESFQLIGSTLDVLGNGLVPVLPELLRRLSHCLSDRADPVGRAIFLRRELGAGTFPDASDESSLAVACF
jgi:hypothetical protein